MIGYVGWWGICVIDQQGIIRKETGGPLPALEPRQTNNAAELYAGEQAIMVLDQLQCLGRMAVASDSELFVKGMKRAAQRWQARGWQGTQGPVAHASLWERLLRL